MSEAEGAPTHGNLTSIQPVNSRKNAYNANGSYRKERQTGNAIWPDQLDRKDCGTFEVTVNVKTKRKTQKKYRTPLILRSSAWAD